MEPIYKRVLIKISGEALAGSNKTGFDFDFVTKVCETVKRCTEMGVEVGIVTAPRVITSPIFVSAGDNPVATQRTVISLSVIMPRRFPLSSQTGTAPMLYCFRSLAAAVTGSLCPTVTI